MPVVGLPTAVEAALNSFLDQNMLSSWRITGGQKYSVITLRFDMADITASHNSESQQYRRVPPSTRARNDRRKQQWLNRSKRDSIMESTSVKQNMKDNRNSQVIDSNVATLPGTCKPGQAGENGATGQTVTVIQNSTDIAGQAEHPNKNNESTKLSPSDREWICSGGESDEDDTPVSDSEDAERSITPDTSLPNHNKTCYHCKKKLGKVWHVCTHCFDVSNICTHCVETHEVIHPKDQISKFVYPDDDSNQPHCTCCGFVFGNNRLNVFKCKICKYKVQLCTKCKNSNMHKRHKDSLERHTRGRLLTLAKD